MLVGLNVDTFFCKMLFSIQDLSKSPKSVKKLLPKRKPERKPSEEEFALRKSMFKTYAVFRCTNDRLKGIM